MVTLAQGYVYVLTGAPAERWHRCHDDSWDTEVEESHDGTFLGTRSIDGAICVVVKCNDGKIRAQTRQSIVEK